MRVLLIIGLLFSGVSIAQDLEAVTRWHQQVKLSTMADGMVNRVHVAEGAMVSKGMLLIELDQRAYKSQLAAAQSRLEALTQLNAEAKRELDRALELYDRTLLSDHERKLAEIEAAKADAAYRAADAELVRVRLQIDYSRITAPFDGVVERVYVQQGQAVINWDRAVPLVNLCATGVMTAVADIDAASAAKLKPEQAVQIGVRGSWIEGEISKLGLEPVSEGPNGARYALEASFSVPDTMLIRAGEKAVLRIENE
jgi:multidrug efflux system membrane fusion protein